MATQVVELTGDEAALLRSLDKVIQKEREHERQLARTGDAGDATGDKLDSALRRVEKANNQAMRAMVRDLQSLGPEGKAAAEELKAQLAAAGKGDFKTVDGILTDLAKLDPAAAAASQAVRAKLAEVDPKEAFRNTLASLKDLGPEGAAIARGIEADMKAAAIEAAGGLDPIIQKLAEIEPTAAKAAARVRTELREADATTRFDNSLKELGRLNPKAAEAARSVITKMSEADQLVKFDGMIAEIEKFNPVAAEEARKFRDEMKESAKDGQDSFGKFSDFTTTKIAGLLASFGGVSALLSEINKYIEEKTKGQADARDYQVRLAEVQQEALKGFVSLTPEERNHLINVAPEQIAKTTNTDRIEITKALGNIDSSATAEQAVAAVEAAARINLLTQEKISDFAVGAITLGRSTGIEDPAKNLALMISTREDSAVDDLQKLANVLGPVVGAAVSTVPSQDKTEASLDAAATFAVLNKAMADSQGNETATASNTLNSRIAALFDGLDTKMVEARSDVEKIKIQIAKSEGEQKKDLAERDRLAKLIASGSQSIAPDRSELDAKIAKARQEFEGKQIDARQRIREIDKKPAGDVTEKDRFDRRTSSEFLAQATTSWNQQQAKLEKEWEQKQAQAEKQRAEKLRLAAKQLEAINLRLANVSEFEKQRSELARHQAFLADAEGFKDPGTLAGRLAALQQHEGLRAQFHSTEFGGEKAGPIFKMLTDPNSPLAKELAEIRSRISANRGIYDGLVASLSGGSSALRTATFGAKADALSSNHKASDDEGAAIEQVRSTLEKTLKDVRQDGLLGWFGAMSVERGIRPGLMNGFAGLAGDSAAEESVDAINRLLGTRSELARDGIDASEAPKVERLEKAIAELLTYINEQAPSLKPGSHARAADRAAALSGDFRRAGTHDRADYFENLARDFRRVADAIEAQNRMIAEQTDLQKQTAENTAPLPEPVPDYDGISRSQMAAEDAR